MARPRLADENRRTAQMPSIRMTPPEMATVKARAARSGLPLTTYARDMILNGQVIERIGGQHDPALMLELGRIGTNLNQAVKKLHQTGVPNPMLEDSAKQLNALMDQLIEKLL